MIEPLDFEVFQSSALVLQKHFLELAPKIAAVVGYTRLYWQCLMLFAAISDLLLLASNSESYEKIDTAISGIFRHIQGQDMRLVDAYLAVKHERERKQKQ